MNREKRRPMEMHCYAPAGPALTNVEKAVRRVLGDVRGFYRTRGIVVSFALQQLKRDGWANLSKVSVRRAFVALEKHGYAERVTETKWNETRQRFETVTRWREVRRG